MAISWPLDDLKWMDGHAKLENQSVVFTNSRLYQSPGNCCRLPTCLWQNHSFVSSTAVTEHHDTFPPCSVLLLFLLHVESSSLVRDFFINFSNCFLCFLMWWIMIHWFEWSGLGLVTPLGCGVNASWQGLIQGKCGIRSLEPSHLKMDGFEEEVVMHVYDQLSSRVTALVQCGQGEGEFDEDFWLHSQVTNYSF